jgi:hypothetical protein
MPDESIITPAMREAVGRAAPPEVVDVERGAIIRFAEAVGDTNSRFAGVPTEGHPPQGEIVAPPTFLRSLPGTVPPLPDTEHLQQVLDGGSTWDYYESIRPGDQIALVRRLESLNEREGRLGKMLLAVYLVEYTNQTGKLVATQRSTIIRH